MKKKFKKVFFSNANSNMAEIFWDFSVGRGAFADANLHSVNEGWSKKAFFSNANSNMAEIFWDFSEGLSCPHGGAFADANLHSVNQGWSTSTLPISLFSFWKVTLRNAPEFSNQ